MMIRSISFRLDGLHDFGREHRELCLFKSLGVRDIEFFNNWTEPFWMLLCHDEWNIEDLGCLDLPINAEGTGGYKPSLQPYSQHGWICRCEVETFLGYRTAKRWHCGVKYASWDSRNRSQTPPHLGDYKLNNDIVLRNHQPTLLKSDPGRQRIRLFSRKIAKMGVIKWIQSYIVHYLISWVFPFSIFTSFSTAIFLVAASIALRYFGYLTLYNISTTAVNKLFPFWPFTVLRPVTIETQEAIPLQPIHAEATGDPSGTNHDQPSKQFVKDLETSLGNVCEKLRDFSAADYSRENIRSFVNELNNLKSTLLGKESLEKIESFVERLPTLITEKFKLSSQPKTQGPSSEEMQTELEELKEKLAAARKSLVVLAIDNYVLRVFATKRKSSSTISRSRMKKDRGLQTDISSRVQWFPVYFRV